MKFVKQAFAVCGLAMLWQFSLMAQNVAQPHSATGSGQNQEPLASRQSGQVNEADATSPSLTDSQPQGKQSADVLPRKYVEMWNTGDLHPIGNMFAQPVFITANGQRRPLETGTLARVIASWRKSMPDLNFKIEDTIVQGDRVAMRLTLTGTYKDRLFPDTAAPAAEPKKIHALEMLMFLIKDDKIAEIWDDYDELAMRYQMGGRWRSNSELESSCKPSTEPSSSHQR